MASAAEQVAASQARERIPTDWLILFAEWTNSSLLSFTQDVTAQPKTKVYAGWELDYRLAFGINVVDPEPGPHAGEGFRTLPTKEGETV